MKRYQSFIIIFYKHEAHRLQTRLKEVEDHSAKQEQLTMQLRQKLDVLEEQDDKNRHLVKKLQEEKDRLDQSLSDSDSQVFTLRQENDKLVESLQDVTETLEQVRKSKQELEDRVDTISQEKDDLEDSLAKARTEIRKLNEDIDSKENLNSALTDMLKEMEGKITLLQQKVLQVPSSTTSTGRRGSSASTSKAEKITKQRKSVSSDVSDFKCKPRSKSHTHFNEEAETDEWGSGWEDAVDLDVHHERKEFHDDEEEVDEESHSEHTQIPPVSNFEGVLELAKVRADYEGLVKKYHDLEENLSSAKIENEKLLMEIKDYRRVRESSEEERQAAIQAKIEAENRLEILSKYFKEKEVELQRELGTLQVSKYQKEENASSLERRMELIKEENVHLRSQLDLIKTELSETERSYKSQLSATEKRAHESWVAARNAEREATELRRDAAFLRQQLAMMAKGGSASSTDGDHDKSAGNLSSSSSILDFLIPPPPPPPPALFAPPPPPSSVVPPHIIPTSGPSSGHFHSLDMSFDANSSRPESALRDSVSITDHSVTGGRGVGPGSSASSVYDFPSTAAGGVFGPPPPPPPIPPELLSHVPPHLLPPFVPANVASIASSIPYSMTQTSYTSVTTPVSSHHYQHHPQEQQHLAQHQQQYQAEQPHSLDMSFSESNAANWQQHPNQHQGWNI